MARFAAGAWARRAARRKASNVALNSVSIVCTRRNNGEKREMTAVANTPRRQAFAELSSISLVGPNGRVRIAKVGPSSL